MTRRWRDNSLLVQSVRLFLIDEVSIAFSKHYLENIPGFEKTLRFIVDRYIHL